MLRSNRVRRLAPGAASVALVLVGCADDSNAGRAGVAAITVDSRPEAPAETSDPSDPSVPESTSPRSEDEAVAFGLCAALRGQANAMAAIANAAAKDIHGKSPEERYAALYDGYDQGNEASIAFRDSLTDLDIPAIPELDDLLDQIATGADAAAAEFVDEQARFAADVGGVVADGDARGRVGELFNSFEKANSLVEPVVGRYERVELKRAFLDESECRNVIQPFALDES